MNNVQIIWFSKKQNTVESSTFGYEFVAMWIAKNRIVAIRYKVLIFFVLLYGPSNEICDNQVLFNKMGLTQSTFSKKHNIVNYHVVRKSDASGILRTGKEDMETNFADLMTKILF